MKKMMMGLCAMALATVACQQPDGYKVNGVTEGFKDGDTLFFFKAMGERTPTDTIFVKDGKFELEGPVDSVGLASILATDGTSGVLFFTEQGNIDITISKNKPPRVDGTKANNAWQKVNDLEADYRARFDSLTAPLYLGEFDEAAQQKVMAQYQVMEEEMMLKVIDIAEQNLDNALGYFVVTSMAGRKEMSPDRLRTMIDKMSAEYQQRQEIADILKMLKGAEALANGKVMPDFTLSTPDGQELSILSEVAKNKITILDFWASWCNPCRDEMPEMVHIYDKFKEKGLGIVGVSIDTDKDAWVKAISDMNMTWTQVGDMKGWNADVVELYQVSAIPFVIVVDQKGVILKKGLRGVALESFIEEKMQ